MIRIKYDFGVYKSGNLHAVHFHNLITQKKEYLGVFKEEKKAKKTYRLRQYEFYSKHKYLLPKGVGVYHKTKRFTYTVYFYNKIIVNKQFDTVQLCVKFRDELVKTIIG